MPDILIRCPIFNLPVPTGYTTEMIILDSLYFELTKRCPACKTIHRWKRADAWVDEQPKPKRKKLDASRSQGGESLDFRSRRTLRTKRPSL
jgi:hypothetical protein